LFWKNPYTSDDLILHTFVFGRQTSCHGIVLTMHTRHAVKICLNISYAIKRVALYTFSLCAI